MCRSLKSEEKWNKSNQQKGSCFGWGASSAASKCDGDQKGSTYPLKNWFLRNYFLDLVVPAPRHADPGSGALMASFISVRDSLSGSTAAPHPAEFSLGPPSCLLSDWRRWRGPASAIVKHVGRERLKRLGWRAKKSKWQPSCYFSFGSDVVSAPRCMFLLSLTDSAASGPPGGNLTAFLFC